jgi:hypothetical protein
MVLGFLSPKSSERQQRFLLTIWEVMVEDESMLVIGQWRGKKG